jgi:hypothetical protein
VSSRRDQQHAEKPVTSSQPPSEVATAAAVDENNNNCDSAREPKAGVQLIPGEEKQCEGADNKLVSAEQAVEQAVPASSVGNPNIRLESARKLKDSLVQKQQADDTESMHREFPPVSSLYVLC